jgi:UDP-2,4-diacetamido-2,4,6-trideoxy-beta-L-altropyranose hydrolase
LISVRPAEIADEADILRWLNDVQVRAVSSSTRPIPAEEHRRWFASLLATANRTIYVAVESDGNESVGACSFEPVGPGRFEISIEIDAASRGRGIGSSVLSASVERFRLDRGSRDVLVARVRPSNEASKKLFLRAGLQPQGDDAAFEVYELS